MNKKQPPVHLLFYRGGAILLRAGRFLFPLREMNLHLYRSGGSSLCQPGYKFPDRNIWQDLPARSPVQMSVTDVFSSLTYRSYIGTLTRDAFDTNASLNIAVKRATSLFSGFPIQGLLVLMGGISQRHSEDGAKEERQRIGN